MTTRWSNREVRFSCALALLLLSISGCGAGASWEREKRATEDLLGVPVEMFPTSQEAAGYDPLPEDGDELPFIVERQARSTPPEIEASYQKRQIVVAEGPDRTLWEAYLGRDDPTQITPGHGFVSTLKNRRQEYGTHHGAVFHPKDIFIGTRQDGLLTPRLFFRDVGSHTTAPHDLSIDSEGRCHLIVADVNIFQDNRLDLFWVYGDLNTGEWLRAWLLEQRGFTSWAHPWTGSWRDHVHALWSWMSPSKEESGLFHVQWRPAGFGRKTRVAVGDTASWDASVHPESGLLLIAYSNDEGLWLLGRTPDGRWTKPNRLDAARHFRLTVDAGAKGSFIVGSLSENGYEFVLLPTVGP